ncbi:MAG: hypothetical protein ACREQZ_10630 [Woeseiaceae bacterium]
MSFFAELRRRNVFRVSIAYAVAAWLILQVIDVVAPLLGLPEWAPKLILVLLAAGFVPTLIFAWAYELTPEGLKKEKEIDRGESITHLTGRKIDFIIIGILVAGLIFLLVERTLVREPPAAAQPREKSIAVLPFVNMSSDTEQEFFSDGITEEILNALASVKELKVAGRTSSFAFKDRNDDFTADRRDPRRRTHSRGLGAQIRHQDPHYGAAHPGRQRLSPVVGVLRA